MNPPECGGGVEQARVALQQLEQVGAIDAARPPEGGHKHLQAEVYSVVCHSFIQSCRLTPSVEGFAHELPERGAVRGMAHAAPEQPQRRACSVKRGIHPCRIASERQQWQCRGRHRLPLCRKAPHSQHATARPFRNQAIATMQQVGKGASLAWARSPPAASSAAIAAPASEGCAHSGSAKVSTASSLGVALLLDGPVVGREVCKEGGEGDMGVLHLPS